MFWKKWKRKKNLEEKLDAVLMETAEGKGEDKLVTDDPVNHPSHYTAGHKIEVIEFLEDWMLPFHLANCVKYICRAGRKDPDKTIEDLEKGRWYLSRYIELLKKEQDGGAP